ncbi:hypothetical protein Syun_026394 [Stephania yunnanensis]|uniref:Uncharacterized protein n=1 Tax=Stephania yunnanensis TaxID=152371 RepID=A0AAP0ETW2_9MAGN
MVAIFTTVSSASASLRYLACFRAKCALRSCSSVSYSRLLRFSPPSPNLQFRRISSEIPDAHFRFCRLEIKDISNGDPCGKEESEIIFLGTGTSEGIPRVSCLTDPSKKCMVCLKATEQGNKNRRLNTSILIRYAKPTGICNLLIDVGK